MSVFHASLFLFLLLFSLGTAAHALLNKRDPPSALALGTRAQAIVNTRDPLADLAWVLTCVLLGGAGALFYWLFGINRIRTHARNLSRRGFWEHGSGTLRDRWPDSEAGDLVPGGKIFQSLRHTSQSVTRRPLLGGNRIGILHNGEDAYPEMLRAIREAGEFVYFCTYLFDSDEIGKEFTQALSQAVRRGVRVRVLLDAFGQLYSYPPASRALRKAGVPTETFLPLSLSLNRFHPNLRTHRKCLLVDGKVAFMGGMNIGSRHLVRREGGGRRVSDIHFKVEGPVTSEFQEVFLADWFFAARESLPRVKAPPGDPSGGAFCRVISGGPNEDFEKLNWILLAALAASRKRVQIMTPYFVPDRVLIASLNSAALRGVEVEVILPEENNLPFVDWASRAVLWEMMEKGVRFYYQPPPFCHGKLLVADDTYALVGSSNWDARSLRLNFELDMEVYDEGLSASLSGHFDQTRGRSREVTLGQLRGEPLAIRFRNSFLKLFLPYL